MAKKTPLKWIYFKVLFPRITIEIDILWPRLRSISLFLVYSYLSLGLFKRFISIEKILRLFWSNKIIFIKTLKFPLLRKEIKYYDIFLPFIAIKFVLY